MATTVIQSRTKIRRKNGAFTGGDLLEGELGINTANGSLYGSTDGASVTLLVDVTGTSASAVSELTDVTLTSLADNEVLQYDTASGKWHNRTLAELGIVATDVADFAAAVTNHADVAANTAARHGHSNKAALDAITSAGSGAVITAAERSSLGTAVQASEKGAADGVATLGADAKIPTAQIPDAVLGQLDYQGVWDASANSPALASAPAASTKGHYYKVSVAGSTALDGTAEWKVGDWAVSNGSAWDKVDNTESVPTVFGRSGAVVAAASDYDASQVDNDSAVGGATVKDALETLDAGKAPASHGHSGADLTSGDVAAARMSTNVASALSATPDTLVFDAGTVA